MPAIWRGNTGLVESPRSPAYEFGERIAMVRELVGPVASALAAAPGRGSQGTGIAAGWRVARSTVNKDRGGVGTLRIEYEIDTFTPSQPLPDDEWSMPESFTGVSLKKNPRYASLTRQTFHDIDVYIATVNSDQSWKDADTRINALPVAQKNLALELIAKLEKGITTYNIFAPVVRLVQYYWSPPSDLSAGNIRQTPPTGPITFPAGIQWLRLADTIAHNGTFWRVERSWQGAPELDIDLYP